MNRTRLALAALAAVSLGSGFIAAQSADNKDDKKQAAAKTATKKEEGEKTYEDVVVVTASRTAESVVEAPASVSVLSGKQLEQTPADDYGDYLRAVPGLTISQVSARDIQVGGRGPTNTLATYELVMMDNRTIYLDFFGFVMWDLLPLDPNEIQQIEVVRGPGSAVWGANALAGVVNVITKSPRDMIGTSITLGAGGIGTRFGNVTHAGASGKFSYKIAGSYYEQDPYERPTGTIPGTVNPNTGIGTQYPSFKNGGTKQPKVNARFDYEQNEDTNWTFQVGSARTDGIIHTGIGPFDIDSGTKMSYVQAQWSHKTWRASLYGNFLDGDADNLLTVGTDGKPINFAFKSETYAFDASNTSMVGKHNVFTYGITARQNNFDLSLAPKGSDRQEFGAYGQDEISLGEHARWTIGGRFDNIDPIGSVFSPRTSFVWEIVPKKQSLRLSYNKAFRAPSLINNYLDVTIVNFVQLGPFPYVFPSHAIGNPDLREEKLSAYELGYNAVLGDGRAVITAAIYHNELKDSTDFYQSAAYTAANPPPGFPLPTFLLDVDPALGGLKGLLPSEFSYRNIGKETDEGFEAGINVQATKEFSFFANYTYQRSPKLEGVDQVSLQNGQKVDAVNQPPRHHGNVGAAYNTEHWFLSGNIDLQSKAFWTDVLDSRFWGPTKSFTTFNLSTGWRFNKNISLTVMGQNLTHERVQQHIFGDILSRKVTSQLTFRF